MKTKTIFKTMAILCIVTFLNGCTGKDGAPGATGPQGPAGTNGSANVTSTFVAPSFTFNGSIYVSNITVSGLTSLNYLSCAVLMYIWNSGNNDYYALPISNWYSKGDEFVFGINSNGSIDIDYYEGTVNYVESSEAMEVVVIPKFIMKKHPNTNWNNYSEVKAIIDNQNLNN